MSRRSRAFIASSLDLVVETDLGLLLRGSSVVVAGESHMREDLFGLSYLSRNFVLIIRVHVSPLSVPQRLIPDTFESGNVIVSWFSCFGTEWSAFQ